ncbi:hypothetical protein CFC21_091164 [Triticum aestivum]|uniref:Uncharacterized protein n=3 Tax=Triticinae TaxID=1648030 RepID=A0A453MVR6_AEGTS|nr:hypothetical protein CFC21_091164 [Triticum aestivum]
MKYMWQSVARVLLLLLVSSGWLEVATARPDQSFHSLNRTLTEEYGAQCYSSSLSVRISRYCDILDESPNSECCDAIFATLGRKDCLCKVVREPNYRSSPISGGDFIVDLYRSCDGGPYISPTAETECEQPGRQAPPTRPPPTPPSPPSARTAEGDLKGLLSFWRKLGWATSSLLLLGLLSFILWNTLTQLAHDTRVRATGWFVSNATNGAETAGDARPPPTWNVITNNIFVCNLGFSQKLKDPGEAMAPANVELSASVSPQGGTPFTSGQADSVEENPESSLLR